MLTQLSKKDIKKFSDYNKLFELEQKNIGADNFQRLVKHEYAKYHLTSSIEYLYFKENPENDNPNKRAELRALCINYLFTDKKDAIKKQKPLDIEHKITLLEIMTLKTKIGNNEREMWKTTLNTYATAAAITSVFTSAIPGATPVLRTTSVLSAAVAANLIKFDEGIDQNVLSSIGPDLFLDKNFELLNKKITAGKIVLNNGGKNYIYTEDVIGKNKTIENLQNQLKEMKKELKKVEQNSSRQGPAVNMTQTNTQNITNINFTNNNNTEADADPSTSISDLTKLRELTTHQLKVLEEVSEKLSSEKNDENNLAKRNINKVIKSISAGLSEYQKHKNVADSFKDEKERILKQIEKEASLFSLKLDWTNYTNKGYSAQEIHQLLSSAIYDNTNQEFCVRRAELQKLLIEIDSLYKEIQTNTLNKIHVNDIIKNLDLANAPHLAAINKLKIRYMGFTFTSTALKIAEIISEGEPIFALASVGFDLIFGAHQRHQERKLRGKLNIVEGNNQAKNNMLNLLMVNQQNIITTESALQQYVMAISYSTDLSADERVLKIDERIKHLQESGETIKKDDGKAEGSQDNINAPYKHFEDTLNIKTERLPTHAAQLADLQEQRNGYKKTLEGQKKETENLILRKATILNLKPLTDAELETNKARDILLFPNLSDAERKARIEWRDEIAGRHLREVNYQRAQHLPYYQSLASVDNIAQLAYKLKLPGAEEITKISGTLSTLLQLHEIYNAGLVSYESLYKTINEKANGDIYSAIVDHFLTDQFLIQFFVPTLNSMGLILKLINLVSNDQCLDPVLKCLQETYEKLSKQIDTVKEEIINTLTADICEFKSEIKDELYNYFFYLQSSIEKMTTLMNTLDYRVALDNIAETQNKEAITSYKNDITKKIQNLEQSIDFLSIPDENPLKYEFTSTKINHWLHNVKTSLLHSLDMNFNSKLSIKPEFLTKLAEPSLFISHLAKNLNFSNASSIPNFDIFFAASSVLVNLIQRLPNLIDNSMKNIFFEYLKKEECVDDFINKTQTLINFLYYLENNSSWIMSLLNNIQDRYKNILSLYESEKNLLREENLNAIKNQRNHYLSAFYSNSTVLKDKIDQKSPRPTFLNLLLEPGLKLYGFKYSYNDMRRYRDSADFLKAFNSDFYYLMLSFKDNKERKSFQKLSLKPSCFSSTKYLSDQLPLSILPSYITYDYLKNKMISQDLDNINKTIAIKNQQAVITSDLFKNSSLSIILQNTAHRYITFAYYNYGRKIDIANFDTLPFHIYNKAWDLIKDNNFYDNPIINMLFPYPKGKSPKEIYQTLINKLHNDFDVSYEAYKNLCKKLTNNNSFEDIIFSEEKSENEVKNMLVFSLNKNIIPIILSMDYVKKSQNLSIKKLYEIESMGKSMVQVFYDLRLVDKLHCDLLLIYKLIPSTTNENSITKEIIVASRVMQRFDYATYDAFRVSSDEVDLNKFLFNIFVRKQLPGANSLIANDEFMLAPLEYKFHNIIDKLGDKVFSFNHRLYTKAIYEELLKFKDCNNISLSLKAFILEPIIEVMDSTIEEIYKNAKLDEAKNIFNRLQNKKAYDLYKSDIYNHYETLAACIRLNKNIDVSTLIDKLYKHLNLLPPDHIFQNQSSKLLAFSESTNLDYLELKTYFQNFTIDKKDVTSFFVTIKTYLDSWLSLAIKEQIGTLNKCKEKIENKKSVMAPVNNYHRMFTNVTRCKQSNINVDAVNPPNNKFNNRANKTEQRKNFSDAKNEVKEEVRSLNL